MTRHQSKKLLSDFSRDQAPEREIKLWEHLAKVYADEQKLRPNSNKAQRFLLFKVLIHAMAYGTMLTEERILEVCRKRRHWATLHGSSTVTARQQRIKSKLVRALTLPRKPLPFVRAGKVVQLHLERLPADRRLSPVR